MGLDYSFEMWVPREKLFEALSVVAERSPEENADALASLIWPDGRRLLSPSERQQSEQRDVMPIDVFIDGFTGLQTWACLSFGFKPDDALRDYELSNRYRHPNGLLWIGCIDLSISYQSEWLKNEQPLLLLHFQAVTSKMSQLFFASSSVKQFFVDLARSMGALSCHFDFEDDELQLLFLDGREMNLMFYNHWEPKRTHPRFLRQLLGAPLNADERSLCLCYELYELEEGCGADEIIEVESLTRHEDAGLRRAALSALHFAQEEKEFLPLLRHAVNDPDAGVRACIARLLNCHGWERELLQLLEDPQLEVRVAAANSLVCEKHSPQALHRLTEILLSTPPVPQNLALINAAFHALFASSSKPRDYRLELLETLTEKTDFPFPNRARERLESFRRHQT